jgi:hypothetical protein
LAAVERRAPSEQRPLAARLREQGRRAAERLGTLGSEGGGVVGAQPKHSTFDQEAV